MYNKLNKLLAFRATFLTLVVLKFNVMAEFIIPGILLTYIVYWMIRSLMDKLYSEALQAMGVGVLSVQIFVVASYAGQFLRLRMEKDLNIALQSFGLVMLVLSTLFLIGAFLSKRKVSSLTSFWGSTQLFMTRGIYGIIRHPIHLGGILASIGIALLMANAAIIALGLIACLAFFLSSREADRYGQESIGNEYHAYMTSVPAFNFIYGIKGKARAKMQTGPIDFEQDR